MQFFAVLWKKCVKGVISSFLADDQKAGPVAGPIRGAGGGPRAHEGGGPTPESETAAVDQG